MPGYHDCPISMNFWSNLKFIKKPPNLAQVVARICKPSTSASNSSCAISQSIIVILIPFSNLNRTFAMGILFRSIFGLLTPTSMGIPTLSLQVKYISEPWLSDSQKNVHNKFPPYELHRNGLIACASSGLQHLLLCFISDPALAKSVFGAKIMFAGHCDASLLGCYQYPGESISSPDKS